MATQFKEADRHEVLAVSGPGGGVARQYRVQYHTDSDPNWRMYASFRLRDDAENCLRRLVESGCQARLIRYSITPAAA